MKKLLIIGLFLLAAQLQAQILTKKDIAPVALMFASGFCDGTAEALKFHYASIDEKFAIENDQFWNPDISWTNKYKDHNPDLGPAYFGSTSFLAFTTDGYHLMRWGRNITAVTAITIKIGERQKWYEYLIEAVTFYLSYTFGFTLSYDLIFK